MRLIFQGEQVRVCRCNLFGNDVEFDISLHGRTQNQFLDAFQKWQGGSLIQDAFSWLTNGEREFLITGITPEEWDNLFQEEDCGEEDF